MDSALTVQRSAFRQVIAAHDAQIDRLAERGRQLEERADSIAGEAARLRRARLETPPLPDTATASDSASYWQGQAVAATIEADRWKLAYEAADSSAKAGLAALRIYTDSLLPAAESRIADLERLLAQRPDNGKLMECGPGPGVGTSLRGELVFACVVPMISIPSPF